MKTKQKRAKNVVHFGDWTLELRSSKKYMIISLARSKIIKKTIPVTKFHAEKDPAISVPKATNTLRKATQNNRQN